MVIQELFKPKNKIVGKVVKIEKQDNALEGIKQDYYCFDIITDEGDHYKEEIPCRKEVINSLINEIKRLLPETTDMQDEEDIIRKLHFKRFEWVKRQFGSQILELPPLFYFFPQEVKEKSEQTEEEINYKYSKKIPELIEYAHKENPELDEKSFKEGFYAGVHTALKNLWETY
ncbi:MAG: hypothetical protein Q7R52_02850 [archaeon]|nr:hypothetical protein [archaeon]